MHCFFRPPAVAQLIDDSKDNCKGAGKPKHLCDLLYWDFTLGQWSRMQPTMSLRYACNEINSIFLFLRFRSVKAYASHYVKSDFKDIGLFEGNILSKHCSSCS